MVLQDSCKVDIGIFFPNLTFFLLIQNLKITFVMKFLVNMKAVFVEKICENQEPAFKHEDITKFALSQKETKNFNLSLEIATNMLGECVSKKVFYGRNSSYKNKTS